MLFIEAINDKIQNNLWNMMKAGLKSELFGDINLSFATHLIESGSSRLLLFTGEILEDMAARRLYSIRSREKDRSFYFDMEIYFAGSTYIDESKIKIVKKKTKNNGTWKYQYHRVEQCLHSKRQKVWKERKKDTSCFDIVIQVVIGKEKCYSKMLL